MTTSHTQDFDVIADTDPGIAFDTADESWTISTSVLVSSGRGDGVDSDFAGSSLFNQGSIVTAAEFGAGVDLAGDHGLVANAAGARIIGVGEGIIVDGDTVDIDNRGLMQGLIGSGVALATDSTHVVLTNSGMISGRASGVGIFSLADGGVIHNLGLINSDEDGIEVDTATGLTTVVTNAAGATIQGPHGAIFVDAGGLSLTNFGTLVGGVFAAPSTDATIVNHGTIEGVVGLGNGNDVFIGTGGNAASVFSSGGNDRLTGSGKADLLAAGLGNDRLAGAAGNDQLDGGPGLDTLTGGAGRDQFIFEDNLDPVHNVGRITDFAPGVDKIVLAHEIFAHLGHEGVLPAAEFHIGAAAADRSDRIVYNPATGFLFYDADGIGGSREVHFATVTPHLDLHNTDFLVSHFLISA